MTFKWVLNRAFAEEYVDMIEMPRAKRTDAIVIGTAFLFLIYVDVDSYRKYGGSVSYAIYLLGLSICAITAVAVFELWNIKKTRNKMILRIMDNIQEIYHSDNVKLDCEVIDNRIIVHNESADTEKTDNGRKISANSRFVETKNYYIVIEANKDYFTVLKNSIKETSKDELKRFLLRSCNR